MPPSRSTLYRQKLKSKDPEKFEEYKRKQRERAAQNRAKLRSELAKKKPSQKSLDELQKRRQQGLQRQKKYLAKKVETGQTGPLKIQLFKPRTRMQSTEQREYWRKAQQKCRSNWTRQKKVCVRKKDREYQKCKRDAQRPQECSKPGYNSNQSAYNATSKARKCLPKTPQKFATVMSSLLKRTTPQLRNIIHSVTIRKSLFSKKFTQSLDKRDIKLKQMLAAKFVKKASQRLIAKELKMNRITVNRVSKPKKSRKYKVDIAHVRKLFLREDVSRPLPQKRFATKHGPGYLMQISLKSAFQLYREENPNISISFSTFAKLRPKNVRLLSSNHREFCLCVYCINVRYKLLALNRVAVGHGRSDKRVDSEAEIVDVLLCRKSDGSRFHQPGCIYSSCEECSDHASTLKSYYADLPQDTVVSWNHWEKKRLPNGKERRLLITKSDKLSVLLAEFIEDVTRPSQGMTFVKHVTTAKWQYLQFNSIKDRLPKNTVLEVLDFAKNRNVFYQDEIKSAFFSSAMITIHPIVAFYRKDDNIERNSVIIISEDNQHDYHAVKHFCKIADAHIAKAMGSPPEKIIVFSDGCAAQYKSKGPFADLSLTQDIQVSRNYFGSEHGKGQSDGETGILNRALDRAILGRQVVINNAEQMFNWCQENMTLDEPLSKRHFIFVKNGDICRERPYTDVKCIPQSRKIHQAENIIGKPYMMKKRRLSCFCTACVQGGGICPNKEYVGSFEVKKLSLVQPTLTIENGDIREEVSLETDLLEGLDIEDLTRNVDLHIGVDDYGVYPETSNTEQNLIRYSTGNHVLVKHGSKFLPAVISDIQDNVLWIFYFEEKGSKGLWVLHDEEKYSIFEQDCQCSLDAPDLVVEGGSRFCYKFNLPNIHTMNSE